MSKKVIIFLFLAFLFVFQFGCAKFPEGCVNYLDPLEFEPEDPNSPKICEVADPLKPLNRIFFEFNDFTYNWVFEPVDKHLYQKLPEKIRTGVSNFFTNIFAPVRFVGSAMQGKKGTDYVLGEFIVNTIFGLGFIDWIDYKYSDDEDIGQGLASWGMGEGFYIVWPFFGPRTLRSSIGDAPGFLLSPTSQMAFLETSMYCSLYSIERWDDCSESYLSLTEEKIDPYLAVRQAYIDNRRWKIRN